MNKNMVISIKSIILIILSLLFSCGHSGKDENVYIIATVGTKKIDWKQIQRSYQLTPKWGKGLTYMAAYHNQLDFLIDEKLFAQAAMSEGLEKDPKISGYLDFILKKEMIKELYRQKVADKLQISNQEYQAAYSRMKKKYKFNYIYSPSKDHAEEYFKKLNESSFDEIQIINVGQEFKGISPEYTFGDMQEELEEVIFEMTIGQVKGPIKVSDGFMVVQLIDGSIEKFTSERDFAEKKSQIKKVIFDRKAGKAANIFIKDLMADKNLTLNPPIFYALSDQLSKIIQDKVSETPLPIYLDDQEINATQRSVTATIDEVLISYRDGEMTVRDFLRELMKMPADLRPNIKMAEQLKNAIGVIIRNEYLAKQAAELGLEKHPNVLYETAIQTDEILSKIWLSEFHKRQLKSENRKKLETEDPELKRENNQAIFQPNQGNSDKWVSHLKFQEFRMNASDSLKKIYPVSLDTTLLYSRINRPEDTIRYDPVKMVLRELFN